MVSRWTSRKFLMTLTAQLAALGVLIWPSEADAVRSVVETVASLAVLLLSALGYVTAEASVDRSRAGEERA